MIPAATDLVLGPRAISYGEPSGEDDETDEGSVLMTLRSVEAGDVIGWANIELDGQSARLDTRGPDELQVTYELILLSGAWLIETAKARGITLFAWGLKPAETPMDIFEL
ncbi:hypothetical protein [Caulobacter sp.]|uniref:hypothetical protein n=1 Tax=Caulobacter sp. TaxID=78 RepID=UPI003BAE3F5B